ncbi:MAG: pyridoxamine 5'-phosphate oxidase family protein [Gemmatimonadaceae bacterium]|nr:pyridoxamine 5'-phosphate oxidase family protein [Gemmatimonadaceae bacterium]
MSQTATSHDTLSDEDAAAKLRDLVKDIRVAMLTTHDADGTLHSRPMYAQEAEFDGDLWFATAQSSSLVRQLQARADVLATFADTHAQRYVVVRGHAEVTQDRDRIREFWNPGMKVWFPAGPEDPEIALVRVHAQRADYWDSPAAPLRWLQFVTALATGKRPDAGDRVGLDLDGTTPSVKQHAS